MNPHRVSSFQEDAKTVQTGRELLIWSADDESPI